MRCYVCDATQDGTCTLTSWRKNRQFFVDEAKPWLEICSDCTQPAKLDLALYDEVGEFAVIEDWDDER